MTPALPDTGQVVLYGLFEAAVSAFCLLPGHEDLRALPAHIASASKSRRFVGQCCTATGACVSKSHGGCNLTASTHHEARQACAKLGLVLCNRPCAVRGCRGVEQHLFHTPLPCFTTSPAPHDCVTPNSSFSCTQRWCRGRGHGGDGGDSSSEVVVRASGTHAAAPRVIASVFAGRRAVLRLLMRQLRRELDAGIVTQIELWDFCSDARDSAYLRALATAPRVSVFQGAYMCRDLSLRPTCGGEGRSCDARAQHVFWHSRAAFKPCDAHNASLGWYTFEGGRVRDWLQYYRHYARQLGDGDVLLKLDDDLVHIEDLRALVSYAQQRRPSGLVYPSIVNNDVGAKWQMRDGAFVPDGYDLAHVPSIALAWTRRHETTFPRGSTKAFSEPDEVCRAPRAAELAAFRRRRGPDVNPPRRICHASRWDGQWSNDPNAALRALAHWLRAPWAFRCAAVHVWSRQTRVSINSFAGIGSHVRAVFSEVERLASGASGEFPLDDEPLLSFVLPHRRRDLSHVVMATTAVHLHFTHQREEVLAAQALELIEAFQALRRRHAEPSGNASKRMQIGLNPEVLWLPARRRKPGGRLMIHLAQLPERLLRGRGLR